MSSSAPPLEHSDPRPLFQAPVWLISRAVDLTILFGGVFVSFFFLWLWHSGYMSTEILALTWLFVFHGPHFWGQISRTFLDRSEWQLRGDVLKRSLLWFVAGPVFVAIGLGLEQVTGRPDFWQLFAVLAGLWAYHHVVKQHFGFVALYRAKHREFDRGELMLHKRYLIASLWLPVLVWYCSASVLPQLPFVMWTVEGVGLDAALTFSNWVTRWGPWVFAAVQLAFVVHLFLRVRRGRAINVPETLILVASVSLHWAVVRICATPELGIGAVAVIVPLVTIYHNLQYHALLWYYNRAKYRKESARETYGAAAVANSNMFVYFGLGIVYTAVTIGFQYYDLQVIRHVQSDPASMRLVALVIGAALWGYSFLHYWLDGKIWHVREDAELRRVLGFEDPPKA